MVASDLQDRMKSLGEIIFRNCHFNINCSMQCRKMIILDRRPKTYNFLYQGDEERRLEMPVSLYCDREQPNVFGESQTGFLKFICLPLWRCIAKLSTGSERESECQVLLNLWVDQVQGFNLFFFFLCTGTLITRVLSAYASRILMVYMWCTNNTLPTKSTYRLLDSFLNSPIPLIPASGWGDSLSAHATQTTAVAAPRQRVALPRRNSSWSLGRVQTDRLPCTFCTFRALLALR